ncbi:MAG: hypothetical protein JWR16_3167 [Nevskia sp.]|nr:hypothetical protein [Nevskia sp.]
MSDASNFLTYPSPLWRRIAAAVYDSLLLIGVWMGVTMLYVPLRDVLGGDARNAGLPALLFLAGAGFFGWSWTHGGQTPGMLAWHLQVRRADAAGLRWPIAVGRYSLMLATWALCLLPLMLLLPQHLLERIPQPLATALSAALLTLIAIVSCLRDGRRRAPCDRLTGTEVVVIPKKS